MMQVGLAGAIVSTGERIVFLFPMEYSIVVVVTIITSSKDSGHFKSTPTLSGCYLYLSVISSAAIKTYKLDTASFYTAYLFLEPSNQSRQIDIPHNVCKFLLHVHIFTRWSYVNQGRWVKFLISVLHLNLITKETQISLPTTLSVLILSILKGIILCVNLLHVGSIYH